MILFLIRKKWKINADEIQLSKMIGKGAMVVCGEEHYSTTVAIKTFENSGQIAQKIS